MKVKAPVSVVISTRKRDEDFIQRTRDRFGHPGTELMVFENNGSESLASLYNRGLRESVNPVVVFMHDDVEIETPHATQKLLQLFNNHPNHGVIGLAGASKLVDGVWWSQRESLYGQVKHWKEGAARQLNYSASLGDRLRDVVCVDGLFFAVRKDRVRKPFDEGFTGFHFYEIPFCVQNFVDGVGIGVTTKIMVFHKSPGELNEDWKEQRLLFLRKYGHLLPLAKP